MASVSHPMFSALRLKERARLDNGVPGKPQDPLAKRGTYCIRAVSEIGTTNQTDGHYVGRSSDYDIVEKTMATCVASATSSRAPKRCTQPEVTFTAWDERCDDAVRYFPGDTYDPNKH